MKFHDNDYEHFKQHYPFYLDIFKEYDKILNDQFNCELGVRIRDSTHNDRIVYDVVRLIPKPIIGLNSDVQNLLVQLENQINCTCNRCGKRQASYRHLDHRVFEVNQSVMCDECFSKDFAVAQPRNSENAFVAAPSIDIVKEDVNLKTPSNIKTNWIRKIKKMFAFLSINNR